MAKRNLSQELGMLSLFPQAEETQCPETFVVRKNRFVGLLQEMLTLQELHAVRAAVRKLSALLLSPNNELGEGLDAEKESEDCLEIQGPYLLRELEQIAEALTLQRAQYYLRRLIKALTEEKTGKINDINLNRWKEYEEIITDSLWIVDRRDTSGAHLGWYWGNFIPQIPRQMMLRYTKKGEWVLDPFAGSGTTLIECRRLGRNGIGIELNPVVAQKARELLVQEPNHHRVTTEIWIGDSTSFDFRQQLAAKGIQAVQLLILHPPYHDIIQFSEDPRDLSNSCSVEDFLQRLKAVVVNTSDVLEQGRYLVLVIGDKYAHGEWIPLGFYAMQEVLDVGYKLKSIVVKNFEETRGKRNQKELWRYRALVGGFYVFKHEYIFIFRKV